MSKNLHYHIVTVTIMSPTHNGRPLSAVTFYIKLLSLLFNLNYFIKIITIITKIT